MHACGHDGHMAIGLAVAERLTRNAPARGLRFLHQPAEEGHGGAEACVKDGALEGVEAALGLHLWNTLPVGTIGLNRGALMAAVDEFTIEIEGPGGHGAMPHETVDPILAAARSSRPCRSIVSREISPLDSAVVTIGRIQGGTAFNIIPKTVTLQGTARSFTPEAGRAPSRKDRPDRPGHGGRRRRDGEDRLRQAQRGHRQRSAHRGHGHRSRGADRGRGERRDRRADAGRRRHVGLSRAGPGLLFFVGCAPEGEQRPHHSSRFDFDERALGVGVAVLEAAARDVARRALTAASLPTLPVVALAVYLAAVLAIGSPGAGGPAATRPPSSWRTGRSARSGDSRGLASLTTGGSTTIALAALVYTHGVAGLWLDLAGALGSQRSASSWRARVRREGAVTLPEIIGRYYGTAARRVAARPRARFGDRLVRAADRDDPGRPDSAALGLRPTPALVLSTAVFVAYTALGGQFAVVAHRPAAVRPDARRDPGHRARSAPSRSGRPRRPAAGGLELPDLTRRSRLGDILAMLVLIGLPHLVGSDVTLKLLSCRDEMTARRAALLAAGSKIALRLLGRGVALAARKALPPMPPVEALPAAVLGLRASGARGPRPGRARRDDADLGGRRPPLRGRRHRARPRACPARAPAAPGRRPHPGAVYGAARPPDRAGPRPRRARDAEARLLDLRGRA